MGDIMNRITFTIGQGKDKEGKDLVGSQYLSLPEMRERAFKRIAGAYGGYTATIGKGGWISPKGELVEEPSLTIITYDSHTYSALTTSLNARGMAQWLRELFNQEQVMLTIEPVEVDFISAESDADRINDLSERHAMQDTH